MRMYNSDGADCEVDKDQVKTMEAAGWSKQKELPESDGFVVQTDAEVAALPKSKQTAYLAEVALRNKK